MLYNIHDSIQNSAVVDTSKKILPEIIALVETNGDIKKRHFPRFKNKILSSSDISLQTVRIRLLCVRSPFCSGVTRA